MQGCSVHGANSILGLTRMDNSFVVLPKQKPQAPGVPPRPRSGAVQPDTGQSGKAMEESFVVVYKSEPSSDGGGSHLPSIEGGPNGQLHPNNAGFNSTITVLKRAFEIATTPDTGIKISRSLDWFSLVLGIMVCAADVEGCYWCIGIMIFVFHFVLPG
jgi:beclin 1